MKSYFQNIYSQFSRREVKTPHHVITPKYTSPRINLSTTPKVDKASIPAMEGVVNLKIKPVDPELLVAAAPAPASEEPAIAKLESRSAPRSRTARTYAAIALGAAAFLAPALAFAGESLLGSVASFIGGLGILGKIGFGIGAYYTLRMIVAKYKELKAIKYQSTTMKLNTENPTPPKLLKTMILPAWLTTVTIGGIFAFLPALQAHPAFLAAGVYGFLAYRLARNAVRLLREKRFVPYELIKKLAAPVTGLAAVLGGILPHLTEVKTFLSERPRFLLWAAFGLLSLKPLISWIAFSIRDTYQKYQCDGIRIGKKSFFLAGLAGGIAGGVALGLGVAPAVGFGALTGYAISKLVDKSTHGRGIRLIEGKHIQRYLRKPSLVAQLATNTFAPAAWLISCAFMTHLSTIYATQFFSMFQGLPSSFLTAFSSPLGFASLGVDGLIVGAAAAAIRFTYSWVKSRIANPDLSSRVQSSLKWGAWGAAIGIGLHLAGPGLVLVNFLCFFVTMAFAHSVKHSLLSQEGGLHQASKKQTLFDEQSLAETVRGRHGSIRTVLRPAVGMKDSWVSGYLMMIMSQGANWVLKGVDGTLDTAGYKLAQEMVENLVQKDAQFPRDIIQQGYNKLQTAEKFKKTDELTAFCEKYKTKYRYDDATGTLIVKGMMANEEKDELQALYSNQSEKDAAQHLFDNSQAKKISSCREAAEAVAKTYEALADLIAGAPSPSNQNHPLSHGDLKSRSGLQYLEDDFFRGGLPGSSKKRSDQDLRSHGKYLRTAARMFRAEAKRLKNGRDSQLGPEYLLSLIDNLTDKLEAEFRRTTPLADTHPRCFWTTFWTTAFPDQQNMKQSGVDEFLQMQADFVGVMDVVVMTPDGRIHQWPIPMKMVKDFLPRHGDTLAIQSRVEKGEDLRLEWYPRAEHDIGKSMCDIACIDNSAHYNKYKRMFDRGEISAEVFLKLYPTAEVHYPPELKKEQQLDEYGGKGEFETQEFYDVVYRNGARVRIFADGSHKTVQGQPPSGTPALLMLPGTGRHKFIKGELDAGRDAGIFGGISLHPEIRKALKEGKVPHPFGKPELAFFNSAVIDRSALSSFGNKQDDIWKILVDNKYISEDKERSKDPKKPNLANVTAQFVLEEKSNFLSKVPSLTAQEKDRIFDILQQAPIDKYLMPRWHFMYPTEYFSISDADQTDIVVSDLDLCHSRKNPHLRVTFRRPRAEALPFSADMLDKPGDSLLEVGIAVVWMTMKVTLPGGKKRTLIIPLNINKEDPRTFGGELWRYIDEKKNVEIVKRGSDYFLKLPYTKTATHDKAFAAALQTDLMVKGKYNLHEPIQEVPLPLELKDLINDGNYHDTKIRINPERYSETGGPRPVVDYFFVRRKGELVTDKEGRKSLSERVANMLVYGGLSLLSRAELDHMKLVTEENYEKIPLTPGLRTLMQNRRGTVEKARIPAKELRKVAHLFIDPTQDQLVFKPDITTREIAECEVIQETRDILQRAHEKYSYNPKAGWLVIRGSMTEEEKTVLRALYPDQQVRKAIERLYSRSQPQYDLYPWTDDKGFVHLKMSQEEFDQLKDWIPVWQGREKFNYENGELQIYVKHFELLCESAYQEFTYRRFMPDAKYRNYFNPSELIFLAKRGLFRALRGIEK